jgi:hypothetical protein
LIHFQRANPTLVLECYVSNNFKFHTPKTEVSVSFSKKSSLDGNEQLKWGILFFNALFLQKWERSKVEMTMWFA